MLRVCSKLSKRNPTHLTAQPPVTRLTLHRLATDRDPRFTASLRLYTEAFPPEERKPAAQLRAMLRQPRYRFLIAEQAGLPVGLAILMQAETAKVALLEYLAVQPESRGHGIGRWLLLQVLHSVDTTTCPLLIETESDREHSPDQALRQRRKQFYRAAGAREVIGLRYLMPAVSTLLPPPMQLMLFAQPMPASLPKQRLHPWLAALYSEVYRQPPNDSRLAEMLRDLPEAILIT